MAKPPAPLSLPFHSARDLDSELVRRSLKALEARAERLPAGASEEARQIKKFIAGVKSLKYATPIEYADFLRTQIEMGRKIARIPVSEYGDSLKVFKTTKEITDLPDSSWSSAFSIMVMPGHTLRRENPKDDTKIYDWSGNLTNGDLILTRSVASIMLARRWKPHPDHFEQTFPANEIDKLLARGKKSEKVYADTPYAIFTPKE